MGVMIIPSSPRWPMTASPLCRRRCATVASQWARPPKRDDPQVLVPAALPGVVGGVLLAVSRAIGETMIVVMAAGLAANLTAQSLRQRDDRDRRRSSSC
jgi:phosphate transport system permease protein